MLKVLKWTVASVVFLALLITALSYVVRSDMLRDYLQREANRNLKGYTVHIGSAYFHPLTLSLDLEDVVLVQQANPAPPVASAGSLHASIHWRALLSRRLVGDILIDRPKVYVNLGNVRTEERSKVPLKQKGWQEALFAIYPLLVDVLTINDGDITYVDQGPFPPLHIGHVTFTADNIRNIRYADQVYPSPISLKGTVFEKGSLTLRGNANFLAEPHATAKGELNLVDVPLAPFKPITSRQNLSVDKGSLSAAGTLEYAAKRTAVALKEVAITGVDVTYFHSPKTATAEAKRVREAGRTARKLSNEPTTQLSVALVTIRNSSFGYLDKTSSPSYRLFIDNAHVAVRNFSNQLSEKPATFELKGRFMGSGKTDVQGSFVPKTKTPDLRFKVEIVDTEMTTMSKLFEAYGKFDIQAGLFSLYSEGSIRGNRIQGYVKPLFRNMQVTDLRTDQEKGFLHKLYITGIKIASKILKNRPRSEVATQVEFSGTIDNPQTSIMQIIGNLVRNAFIRAILPGFEKEAKPQKK
jgi:hypothetical protein